MQNKGVNLVRMREDDILVLNNGDKIHVDSCWNNGDLFQVKSEEEIYTFDILGRNLNAIPGEGKNVKELIEVEKESDKETFYVPRFDVDMLPVLTVNGSDRIIRTLFELNGLEVTEPQMLQAQYKYVIVGTLRKVHGRDIDVLKQDEVICQSKEECEDLLKSIENLNDKQDFDSLLTKLKTNASVKM